MPNFQVFKLELNIKYKWVLEYVCLIHICLVNCLVLGATRLNKGSLYWIRNKLYYHWGFELISVEGVIPCLKYWIPSPVVIESLINLVLIICLGYCLWYEDWKDRWTQKSSHSDRAGLVIDCVNIERIIDYRLYHYLWRFLLKP